MQSNQQSQPSEDTSFAKIVSIEEVEVVEPGSRPVYSGQVTNRAWAKEIPLTNFIFIVVCSGILLFIDLPIVISSPSLAPFLFMMLAAVGIMVVLALIEYIVSRSLKDLPYTKLDGAIASVITIRNAIVVLNVIPLIQLLGLMADLAVPILLLLEFIWIAMRLRRQ